MQKIMIGLFIGIITVLLIVFFIIGFNGEELKFTKINMDESSTLDEPNATCAEYYGKVISNIELYDTFISTCGITDTYNYDSEYFNDNIFVVYIYTETVSREPKAFNDYFFTVSGKEVIKIDKNNSLFPSDIDSWNIYLVEMGKDNISSSKVIFD